MAANNSNLLNSKRMTIHTKFKAKIMPKEVQIIYSSVVSSELLPTACA